MKINLLETVTAENLSELVFIADEVIAVEDGEERELKLEETWPYIEGVTTAKVVWYGPEMRLTIYERHY